MKIEGLCALVTGGASGIGKSLIERLLSKNAKFVAFIDINKVTGEETFQELKKKYGEGKVRFIACDISNDKELEEAFKEAFTAHGRIDLLFNSAGVLQGPNVLRINLEGTIRCCGLAKKYMSKENGGHGGVVLNMGSVTSFAAIFDPLYVASKHGVKGYSLALAECDPSFSGADDIRIAVMCPTGVDTPFLKASPETLKTSLNLIPMSRVLDACIMAVEDETKHACCIRITHAFGIDLLPMKTPKEWETELKIWKS